MQRSHNGHATVTQRSHNGHTMVMQRSHNGLDHTISTVVKHGGMESFFDAYCTCTVRVNVDLHCLSGLHTGNVARGAN